MVVSRQHTHTKDFGFFLSSLSLSPQRLCPMSISFGGSDVIPTSLYTAGEEGLGLKVSSGYPEVWWKYLLNYGIFRQRNLGISIDLLGKCIRDKICVVPLIWHLCLGMVTTYVGTYSRSITHHLCYSKPSQQYLKLPHQRSRCTTNTQITLPVGRAPGVVGLQVFAA